MQKEKIRKARQRRNWRSRRKIFGTPDRPRLVIFRSGRHIYAQVIDDLAGVTLASSSTRAKLLRGDISYGGNKDAAKSVGTAIAKQAMDVGIKAVCFDRNGYRYHGRIKSLADAARQAGLAF
ncbi:MAG: 50S ribosomal protein L18 [Planctomycetota bacterium]|nr:MAG: 50S ribosomal protein L18 [Planctomycetota bacterium]RKY13700.1 MAG: 50S ribosomal protein L18 [Planctomycetota bacterium]